MSKSTILILASLVLTVTTVVLVWLNMRVAAPVTGFLAFLLGQVAVMKGSAKWIVIISLLAGAAFGLALCPQGGMFCLMAALFFLTLMMTVRLLFLEQLNYTRMKWLEPTLFVIGVSYYIVGNIYDGSGWLSWAFPAPTIGFAGFMIMGQTIGYREMKANLIERFAAEVGKPAPEISLPDQDGKTVNLSDFKGKRHVLLIFVRGDWCPTCHIMLRSYEKNKEKFAAKNIMLLAIGPDNVAVNKEMVVKLGLDYNLLSDGKLEAVKAYGMQTVGNNPMTKYAEGIPLPASFLIDINGVVRYTSNPQVSGEILNPETIFPIVEKLQATA